jgi:anti-anti-sigma factor
MSEVSFLASLGIRTLITAAKTVSNNGGKLVLLSPQPNVERVLRESRIDTVLPIIEDSAAIDRVFVS